MEALRHIDAEKWQFQIIANTLYAIKFIATAKATYV